MRIENFEEFKNKSREATLRWFGKWRGEKNEEKIELSKKAKKIKELIDSDAFEDDKDKEIFGKLVSLIIEEEIPLEIARERFNCKHYYCPLPGVVFILDSNPNSHDYPLRQPILRSGDSHGIWYDGKCLLGLSGNSLPNGKYYVPPTEKEFETFFEEVWEMSINDTFPMQEFMEE